MINVFNRLALLVQKKIIERKIKMRIIHVGKVESQSQSQSQWKIYIFMLGALSCRGDFFVEEVKALSASFLTLSPVVNFITVIIIVSCWVCFSLYRKINRSNGSCLPQLTVYLHLFCFMTTIFPSFFFTSIKSLPWNMEYSTNIHEYITFVHFYVT